MVTIVGRVTMADTGAPVRRARVWVELRGVTTGDAMTDEQGRYVLQGLRHDRYQVVASKAPFVTMKHGQRYPNGPATEVDLSAAATASRVDIALWRGGVIAGRLYDDLGEPAAFAQVVALRLRVRDGQPRLEPTGSAAAADDLGQYRLSGLPTGSYFVAANSPAGAFRLAPSYFPGTQSIRDATRIAVRAGAEQGGTDFEVGFAKASTVSGSVVAEGGPASAMVSLSNGFDPVRIKTGPDGHFAFRNVSPGPYQLTAVLTSDGVVSATTTSVPLSVDGDVSGVVLTMDGGATLRGVVTTDDGTAPTFSATDLMIHLRPVPGSAFAFGSLHDVALRDDWSFEVSRVSGELLIRTRVLSDASRTLPDGWTIHRVLAGSEDVTDSGVRVTKGESADDVRVVLTNQVTEVSGTVFDEQHAPTASCSVVVFSDEPAKWTLLSRFVTVATPDKSGRYLVQRLPPGTYRAVALEFLEEGAEEDPEVLASLRERALKFDLGKGESLKLSLPLTRVK